MEQYFFSYQHWLLQSLGPVAEQRRAAAQLFLALIWSNNVVTAKPKPASSEKLVSVQ